MLEYEEISARIPINMAVIREAVLMAVSETGKKLAPSELEKKLTREFGIERKTVKKVIRKLIDERELTYSYHYGCSFLEKSFNKPVRVSDRIILKPPHTQNIPKADDVVVDIQPGASFGFGEHPSTRLAIRAIEQVMSRSGSFHFTKDSSALDIGTGSGVLAIVAALLGIKRVIGIDIDPCALAEAKKNVSLNNLEHRIEIHDRAVESIDQKFGLITANLRYPTLKRLSPCIAQLSEIGGACIVSGLKTDEESDLVRVYSQSRLKCVWKAYEKDWVGLVFERLS